MIIVQDDNGYPTVEVEPRGNMFYLRWYGTDYYSDERSLNLVEATRLYNALQDWFVTRP